MVYGANGYTGNLISKHAKHVGLDLVLAGRAEKPLQYMAAALDLPYQIFALEDPSLIDSSLVGAEVLLNCAGSFNRTADPLINACMRNGVHYLDTSAEIVSYEIAERKDRQAKEADVMLLPGCGGSVALLGCLAGRLLDLIGGHQLIDSMDLALHVSGPMSRGSACTAQEGLAAALLQRSHGRLTPQDATRTAQFNFENGRGEVNCFPVTLPDLITIPKSLSVQTLRTFAHASGTAFASQDPSTLPSGPTASEREAHPYDAAVTVFAKNGNVKSAVMHFVNGYSFTFMASVEAARRVLEGRYLPGFQTSVTVFGVDFAESILGTRGVGSVVLG